MPTERLADGVYVLTGQGGNMGLSVGAERSFVETLYVSLGGR